MRKLIYLILLFAVLVLSSVAVFRAQTCVSMQGQVVLVQAAAIDTAACVQRLSESLQIPTTYTEAGEAQQKAFQRWGEWLPTAFPLVQARTQQSDWAEGRTRLYKWAGSDENAPAVLLLANYDLQEPDLQTLERWKYSPFAGKIEGGYVWGAGSLQGKSAAVAILSAWEELLRAGFVPRRTIYLLLAGDETQANAPSVRQLAAAFKLYETPFLHILAAGSQIQSAPFADIQADVALIGSLQPHRLGLRLSAERSEELNAALEQLKNWQPAWDSQTEANDIFLTQAAAELPFFARLTAANRGFLGWRVRDWLRTQPRLMAALQPHWQALAVSGSDGRVQADLHLHLPAHCPPELAVSAWKKLLGDTVRLRFEPLYAQTSLSAASEKSASFQMLQTTLKQLKTNIIVLPAGSERATSAAYFQYQNTPVLQFAPLRLTSEDYERQRSGIDERISTEAFAAMVQFYMQYLKNVNI